MLNFKKILFFLFFSIGLNASTFQNLTSIEANFSQIIVNPSKNKVVYEGFLYIEEPSKIKWEYTKPFQKDVYITKNSVTIIEPELEQVIMTKLTKEINIINLLKNAKNISKNSFISTFDSIEYKILFKNNKIQQITYQDAIENNITIIFKNVKQNHDIDEKIFKFLIPLEYDVIKK